MQDELGDRIKGYESVFTGSRVSGHVIARLDGRCFSKFTKGLKGKYDPHNPKLSRLMVDTTKHLLQKSGAVVGYTQSDEITLAWHPDNLFFAGSLFKMVSCLSSLGTVYFNKHLREVLPEKWDAMPTFDCRVFTVPNETEVANTFVWRQQDAIRNSVQSYARHHFSHRQCENKSTKELIELVKAKGHLWERSPDYFRYGTFVRVGTVRKTLDPNELHTLPEKHHARQNPDVIFERSVIMESSLPLVEFVNREDFLLRAKVGIVRPPR